MDEAHPWPDGTIHMRSGGETAGRTPVVFIHGVGMSRRFWAPQMAAFGSRRDCIAYDMLGHGSSPLPPEKACLADYAAQLHALMDTLDIGRAVIVGHSMGALVALEYALDHPERVAAVVPMNAVFRRPPEQRQAVLGRLEALRHGGMEANREQTLRRWFGGAAGPEQAENYALLDEALREADPEGYRRSYGVFATSDAAHAGRLSSLARPACFLTGALDPNSTPAMSEEMAALAPAGRVVVLDGERHMMSFISPEPVNAVLETVYAVADQPSAVS